MKKIGLLLILIAFLLGCGTAAQRAEFRASAEGHAIHGLQFLVTVSSMFRIVLATMVQAAYSAGSSDPWAGDSPTAINRRAAA